MRGKNRFARYRKFGFIIRMDSEQRIALFDLIPDLLVDDKTDRVVHRIGLPGAPSAQCHCRLAYASRLDL